MRLDARSKPSYHDSMSLRRQLFVRILIILGIAIGGISAFFYWTAGNVTIVNDTYNLITNLRIEIKSPERSKSRSVSDVEPQATRKFHLPLLNNANVSLLFTHDGRDYEIKCGYRTITKIKFLLIWPPNKLEAKCRVWSGD